MTIWVDVPEGGGSVASSILRGVVILGIVFGPWLLGGAVVAWIVWRVAKRRRARSIEPPDDPAGT